uniref:Uncharacterized protein n=1 Tax=Setaria viridis TaxID=4556 RepID=A0A4U6VVA8_SETVI|nr:hypothetical protein SEVIR_2G186500v2 [Setaria viridis]TKW32724.1 hypothetical protein SEVIR_2G186500v2 [Setaria viridis]TKW32725.1 hypothetical protein SEVIR_2G186500v2 [Setaria viridis]
MRTEGQSSARDAREAGAWRDSVQTPWAVSPLLCWPGWLGAKFVQLQRINRQQLLRISSNSSSARGAPWRGSPQGPCCWCAKCLCYLIWAL